MTAMSRFWRYLFVGIALMALPKTWPVALITVAYVIVSIAMFQNMKPVYATT